MISRSDPALVQEGEDLLKDCVDLQHALSACPRLSEQVIYKAALYGAVRTPRRGLYYLPDLKTLEKRRWNPED